MLIDNTETIKSVLQFDGSRYYYKFAVIVRRKDYPEAECPIISKEGRREVCVHQWMVSSMEDYERLLPDMLKYTELFKARLYVTLDRKDLYKTLVYADTILRDAINGIALGQKDVSCKSFSKLVNSATSVKESSSKEGKCWLFDVDTKDEPTIQHILSACGESTVCMLKTKSGYHIVCRKTFNAQGYTWPNNVEVKENALGLVAKY